MDQLVAAINDSAAARPVLTAAREIAPMFGDELVALTVCDDGPGATSVDLTTEFGVPLYVRHGQPIVEIAAAARSGEVRGIVVGSRALPTSRSFSPCRICRACGRCRRGRRRRRGGSRISTFGMRRCSTFRVC